MIVLLPPSLAARLAELSCLYLILSDTIYDQTGHTRARLPQIIIDVEMPSSIPQNHLEWGVSGGGGERKKKTNTHTQTDTIDERQLAPLADIFDLL